MPPQTRRVSVLGPAYLDRVIRCDVPLLPAEMGMVLDASVDGRIEPGEGPAVVDPIGSTLAIDPPDGWPGPWGIVRVARALTPGRPRWRHRVRAVGWRDDLGGMGPGYAAALGGVLIHALGTTQDPISEVVATNLAARAITSRPIRVEHPADWTLLLSSGPHGDKLPIGFRGCHAGVKSLNPYLDEVCELRVVASLPNRLAAEALNAPGSATRMFAPALRNMLDTDPPIAAFARRIDLLSCNRREWELLADPLALFAQIPAVAITDGPLGARLYYKGVSGPETHHQPAFPRASPPVDTNRAGEAFGATLVSALLDGGWTTGPLGGALAASAMRRASAAAALVLDRADFGFPTPGEVDEALRVGRVAPSTPRGPSP